MQENTSAAGTAAAHENPWAALSANTQTSTGPAPNAAGDDNPWASLSGAGDAGSTPGATETLALPPGGADNWLGTATPAPEDPGFHLHQLWDGSLPIESWINQALDWFVLHFRPAFQATRAPIDALLTWVEAGLLAVPTLLMIAVMGLLAWQFAGRAIGIMTTVAMLFIAMLGVWAEAMVTLSLVLTSLLFCIVIGLPLGILLATSDRAEKITRPILDAMQTTPAFVYLVPVVMLFGIGNVPGVIVTIVFALPPLVRLTNLGIRQVRPDLIEASRAYGASPWQMLTKVQLPLAMPSIMAGVNQALMLSLSMVVIASMIAVGGLGQMVLRGIGRLDMGLATVGGLGIVLLAIALDRLTQAIGTRQRGAAHWYDHGPVGLLRRLLHAGAPAKTATRTGSAPTSAPHG